MAFGFPAYHEEHVEYDRPRSELLDACLEALHQLGWGGEQTGRWRVRGATGISFWSWGETLTVDIDRDGTLHVRSECALPTQCFDWGRNQVVVQRFLRRLDEVLDEMAQDRRRRPRDPDDDEPEPEPRRRVSDRSVTPASPPPRRPRPRPPDDAVSQ